VTAHIQRLMQLRAQLVQHGPCHQFCINRILSTAADSFCRSGYEIVPLVSDGSGPALGALWVCYRSKLSLSLILFEPTS
jgi:hypothetical protein